MLSVRPERVSVAMTVIENEPASSELEVLTLIWFETRVTKAGFPLSE